MAGRLFRNHNRHWIGRRSHAVAVAAAAATVATSVVLPGSAPLASAQEAGARPTLILLCKYADKPTTPTLGPDWVQRTWTGDPANSFDGLVREASYGVANLAGSKAFGWFTMAGSSTTFPDSVAGLRQLSTDCVNAAKAGGVDTAGYQNLFIYLNASSNAVTGGVTTSTGWAGGARAGFDYDACFVSDIALTSTGLALHELGHLFGGDHTSSSADSLGRGGGGGASWDQAWFNAAAGPWVAGTYNASNRDQMGFVPPARRVNFAGGTQTVTLQRLNQAAGDGPLLVEVPVSKTVRYVVALRTRVGYDAKESSPGFGLMITPGVVIEKTELAPNDNYITNVLSSPGEVQSASGVWGVGQTFTDASVNLSIAVTRVDDTSADVTITGQAGVRLDPKPGKMP